MAELLRADGQYVRVSTLMQVADLELLTGRIVSGAGVEICFYNGDVVRARAGALTGVSAVYESFILTHETLVLERVAIEPAPMLAPLIALIVEGSRLADEWARLSSMKLVLAGELPPGTRPDVARLATRSEGRRTLGALIDIYGFARSALVDPLLSLLESGVLVASSNSIESAVQTATPSATVISSPAAPPVPVPDAASDDFDACMSSARAQVRAGRYDLAIQYFERALLSRPNDPTVKQNLRRLDQLKGDRFS